MGEESDDPGKLIPGWEAYVKLEADRIEASFPDPEEGKSRAGLYMFAAESIRQAANHEIGNVGPLWKVSKVLQAGQVTKAQLEELWLYAQGDRNELMQIFERLQLLGEIDG